MGTRWQDAESGCVSTGVSWIVQTFYFSPKLKRRFWLMNQYFQRTSGRSSSGTARKLLSSISQWQLRFYASFVNRAIRAKISGELAICRDYHDDKRARWCISVSLACQLLCVCVFVCVCTSSPPRYWINQELRCCKGARHCHTAAWTYSIKLYRNSNTGTHGAF